MLIVHNNQTQAVGLVSTNVQGASVDTSRAYAFSAQFTVTAVSTPSGGSIQLQKSNDGVNWANDGSSVAVGATGVFWVEKIGCSSKFMRVSYVIASGSYTGSTVLCSICDMP